ncbi:MAG: hypothetical protein ACREFY_01120 [Acetobacteraceae bacterium]
MRRCPAAHGAWGGIDLAATRPLPDIHAIITAADLDAAWVRVHP